MTLLFSYMQTCARSVQLAAVPPSCQQRSLKGTHPMTPLHNVNVVKYLEQMRTLAAVRNSSAIFFAAAISTWLSLHVHKEAVWSFGPESTLRDRGISNCRSSYNFLSRTWIWQGFPLVVSQMTINLSFKGTALCLDELL